MNDQKPKGGHVCAVWGCKNTQMNSNLSFFRFPKDIERAKTWAIECGRKDLLKNSGQLYNSYRVCTAHFEKEMFLNDLGNRLQPHATPKIFLKQEGTTDSSEDREHDYSRSASSPNLTEGNKRIQKKYAVEVIEIIPPKISKLSDITEEESTPSLLGPKSVILTNIDNLLEINQEENTPTILSKPESPIQSTSTSIVPINIDNLMEVKHEESASSTVSSDPVVPIELTFAASIQNLKPLTPSSSKLDKLRYRLHQLRNENLSLRYKIRELERKLNSAGEITFEQYKMLTKKFCSSKELADYMNVLVSSAYAQKKSNGKRQ